MIKRQVAEENDYVKLSLNELKNFFSKEGSTVLTLRGRDLQFILTRFQVFCNNK